MPILNIALQNDLAEILECLFEIPNTQEAQELSKEILLKLDFLGWPLAEMN